MFSEINAEGNAKRLEAILLRVIEGNHPRIMEFAKKNLYEWYLSECSEAFMSSSEKIVETFKDKELIVMIIRCEKCGRMSDFDNIVGTYRRNGEEFGSMWDLETINLCEKCSENHIKY